MRNDRDRWRNAVAIIAALALPAAYFALVFTIDDIWTWVATQPR